MKHVNKFIALLLIFGFTSFAAHAIIDRFITLDKAFHYTHKHPYLNSDQYVIHVPQGFTTSENGLKEFNLNNKKQLIFYKKSSPQGDISDSVSRIGLIIENKRFENYTNVDWDKFTRASHSAMLKNMSPFETKVISSHIHYYQDYVVIYVLSQERDLSSYEVKFQFGANYLFLNRNPQTHQISLDKVYIEKRINLEDDLKKQEIEFRRFCESIVEFNH